MMMMVMMMMKMMVMMDCPEHPQRGLVWMPGAIMEIAVRPGTAFAECFGKSYARHPPREGNGRKRWRRKRRRPQCVFLTHRSHPGLQQVATGVHSVRHQPRRT